MGFKAALNAFLDKPRFAKREPNVAHRPNPAVDAKPIPILDKSIAYVSSPSGLANIHAPVKFDAASVLSSTAGLTIPPPPVPIAMKSTVKEQPVSKATVVIDGIEKVAEDALDLIVHPAAPTATLSPGTTSAIAILLQQFLAVAEDAGADVSNPSGLVNIPLDIKQFNDIKTIASTIKADVAKISIKL